jgi:hypothetical protein
MRDLEKAHEQVTTDCRLPGIPRTALYRSAPTPPVEGSTAVSGHTASAWRGLNLCLVRGRLPHTKPPHPAPRLVTLMKRSFDGAG